MTNCRHDPHYGYALEIRWRNSDITPEWKTFYIVRPNFGMYIHTMYLLVVTVGYLSTLHSWRLLLLVSHHFHSPFHWRRQLVVSMYNAYLFFWTVMSTVRLSDLSTKNVTIFTPLYLSGRANILLSSVMVWGHTIPICNCSSNDVYDEICTAVGVWRIF